MWVTFTDNFTRSNGDIGSNYTDIEGNGRPVVASNEVTGDYAGMRAAKYSAASPGSASQKVELTFRSGTDGAHYVWARQTGTAGGGDLKGYRLWDHRWFATYRLQKCNNNTYSDVIGQTAWTISAGDSFGLMVFGTTLAVLKNGAVVTSIDDSAHTATGNMGLAFDLWYTPTPYADDFKASYWVSNMTTLGA